VEVSHSVEHFFVRNTMNVRFSKVFVLLVMVTFLRVVSADIYTIGVKIAGQPIFGAGLLDLTEDEALVPVGKTYISVVQQITSFSAGEPIVVSTAGSECKKLFNINDEWSIALPYDFLITEDLERVVRSFNDEMSCKDFIETLKALFIAVFGIETQLKFDEDFCREIQFLFSHDQGACECCSTEVISRPTVLSMRRVASAELAGLVGPSPEPLLSSTPLAQDSTQEPHEGGGLLFLRHLRSASESGPISSK